MEGARQAGIAVMYMGGINPILHFNQHWDIVMLLE